MPTPPEPPHGQGMTSEAVGLVTGSRPFAGLPDNPAQDVLADIDGMVIDGIRVVALDTPVSRAALPDLLPALVAQYRPRFVVGLGLALGAATVRVETVGINACHFAVPDNFGLRPEGGEPIDPAGPAAHRATWNAPAIVAALLAAGVPAQLSFHAGTHLCNLTLYTYLAALAAAGSGAPCGFLHLPCLPEQVVWLMRQPQARATDAFGPDLDLPSMDRATQRRAVRTMLGEVALQARAFWSASKEPPP